MDLSNVIFKLHSANQIGLNISVSLLIWNYIEVQKCFIWRINEVKNLGVIVSKYLRLLWYMY